MVIVITGPTACGKSAVGLLLAKRVGGEIVSADSMQIYRGLNIGTAKPTPEERASIPHHLVDIRYPWEAYDAAAFASDAAEAVIAIQARGKTPIVVGGTALYLKGYLEGLFDGPGANTAVRARLRAIATAEGAGRLHEMLAEVDPETASRLHPNDEVRVTRALEVYECTGTAIAAQQTQFGRTRPGLNARVVCLSRGRADLRERINRRVDEMFVSGLVDETRSLLAAPDGLGAQAAQALGYKQILAYLNSRLSLSECIESVKRATHRFSRKQATWFRHFSDAKHAEITPQEPADAVCRALTADRCLWRL